MAREKLPSFDETFDEFAAELFAIQTLDLITLRGHALIELALKELLALRLGANVEAIPDLTFARLVSLGTASMPAELGHTLLHLNRLRNYVAHHVHAKELDAKLGEFFRERKRFRISWSRLGTTEKKCYVWAAALGLLATAVGTLSSVLTHFRQAQRDCLLEAIGRDEPTLLADIGDEATEQLDLAKWLERKPSRRKPHRAAVPKEEPRAADSALSGGSPVEGGKRPCD